MLWSWAGILSIEHSCVVGNTGEDVGTWNRWGCRNMEFSFLTKVACFLQTLDLITDFQVATKVVCWWFSNKLNSWLQTQKTGRKSHVTFLCDNQNPVCWLKTELVLLWLNTDFNWKVTVIKIQRKIYWWLNNDVVNLYE